MVLNAPAKGYNMYTCYINLTTIIYHELLDNNSFMIYITVFNEKKRTDRLGDLVPYSNLRSASDSCAGIFPADERLH